MEAERKYKLLAIDDAAINLDLLVEALGDEHAVAVATDGESGLRAVHELRPDLILLDVMMPGLDGFEVCRRLKADAATAEIPVIFLTALADDTDESKGLALGAIDYLNKPFNPELVRLRVNNHLALRAAHQQLRHHADDLETLVRERSQQLADAHARLQVLDQAKREFLCSISHELRTPAHGIIGIGQLALMAIDDEQTRADLGADFELSSNRLIETLELALRLAELQTQEATLRLAPIGIAPILAVALNRNHAAARQAQVTLPQGSACEHRVIGDETLLTDALATLVTAMIKLARPRTILGLATNNGDEFIDIVLTCTGSALSPAALTGFFETFCTARSASPIEALGLAVPVAARVIQAMAGAVRIENGPEGPRLTCRFPAATRTRCA